MPVTTPSFYDGQVLHANTLTQAFSNAVSITGDYMQGPLSMASNLISGNNFNITGGSISNATMTNITTANTLVISTGSTTYRTLENRAAEVVNVKDFGAIGNGVADDGPAFNAALAYIRSHETPSPTGDYTAIILEIPSALYNIKTSINATGIRSLGWQIRGNGSKLQGNCAGQIVLDLMYSRYVHVSDLVIEGQSTNQPTLGIAFGRINNQVADCLHFDNVTCEGYFSLAACYNLGSETVLHDHCRYWNANTSNTAYCLIQDGCNHFNIASLYQTQTIPQNQSQSFNENSFLSLDLRNQYGPCLWTQGAARHRYISSYFATQGQYSVVLYCDNGTNTNYFLDLDVHMETLSLQHAFFITGSNAYPNLGSLRWRDHGTQVNTSVFLTDTNIINVGLTDCILEVGGYQNGGCVVFDTPSKYTFTGKYYSGSLTQWNPPTNFQGIVSSSAGDFTVVSKSVPQTFKIPNVFTQWVQLGTFTPAPLSGDHVYIKMVASQGYNATDSQDQESTLYFKGSNFNSTDANGFAGDGYWFSYGQNGASPQIVKWVANSPGVNATSYSLYAYFAGSTGLSAFYTVSTGSGTWINLANTSGIVDPGVASNTVCIPQAQFYVTTQTQFKSTPTFPTPVTGDNSTNGATTAFVTNAITTANTPLTMSSITSGLGGRTQAVYTIPNIQNDWVELGTFSWPTSYSVFGDYVRIQITDSQGYLNFPTRLTSTDIILQISNGSLNTYGFNAACVWWSIGFQSAVQVIKWVGNAPGANANSYTLYIQQGDYPGIAPYTVITGQGTWTHLGVSSVADPGPSSNTVLVPLQQFTAASPATLLSTVTIPNLINAANDSVAANVGVSINQVYHNNSILMVRVV